jgi:DNA-binding transcriptional MerR regulator
MPSGSFTLVGLARAAGMSVDDVKYYQDLGLVPPRRRKVGRLDAPTFRKEHLDRLNFIRRALLCGFAIEDVARFVDSESLVTCGDVFSATSRRLDALRAEGRGESEQASRLAKLRDGCPGVGDRKQCTILETLSGPNC